MGGPYREALTLACADLMSDATPLFIKSPNGVNNVGLNRELYIVNPAAKTSLALEMFEFVGVLFGIALRTKVAIPLDLPSIVWKLLLGDAGDESDVAAFDHLCIQALDNVVGLSEEEVRWSLVVPVAPGSCCFCCCFFMLLAVVLRTTRRLTHPSPPPRRSLASWSTRRGRRTCRTARGCC